MVDFAALAEFQKNEREFLATPIGAKFHRFKNAYFKMASNEWNESVSDVRLRRDDDAAKQAEREFREELDKLIAAARINTCPASEGR